MLKYNFNFRYKDRTRGERSTQKFPDTWKLLQGRLRRRDPNHPAPETIWFFDPVSRASKVLSTSAFVREFRNTQYLDPKALVIEMQASGESRGRPMEKGFRDLSRLSDFQGDIVHQRRTLEWCPKLRAPVLRTVLLYSEIHSLFSYMLTATRDRVTFRYRTVAAESESPAVRPPALATHSFVPYQRRKKTPKTDRPAKADRPHFWKPAYYPSKYLPFSDLMEDLLCTYPPEAYFRVVDPITQRYIQGKPSEILGFFSKSTPHLFEPEANVYTLSSRIGLEPVTRFMAAADLDNRRAHFETIGKYRVRLAATKYELLKSLSLPERQGVRIIGDGESLDLRSRAESRGQLLSPKALDDWLIKIHREDRSITRDTVANQLGVLTRDLNRWSRGQEPIPLHLQDTLQRLILS